jgi:regulator of protease activity HflC (stomatin/prohibitin superfamily)
MTNGTLIGFALAIIVIAVTLYAAIHILPEYDRGVILRLGRVQPLKGPGLIFITRSSIS